MNIFSINGQLFQYLLPSWSPYQPYRQPLLLNERGGNCVFEFCNNIENKFSGGLPCITPSVTLHAFL